MALVISSALGLRCHASQPKRACDRTAGDYLWRCPFVFGFFSVLLYGYHRPRSLGSCLAVASLSVFLLGFLLLGLAVEGADLSCDGRANRVDSGLDGRVLGYLVQQRHWARFQTSATFSALLLFVPFLMGDGSIQDPKSRRFLKSRHRWKLMRRRRPSGSFSSHFQPFLRLPNGLSELESPIQFDPHFEDRGSKRSGNANSQAAGSSNRFRSGRRTSASYFRYPAEPLVMEELSPYGHIHTRHVDGGYFQAHDAEFVLTRLPGGRTLLTGTSRYRNRMWPVSYWRLWSDAIVHQIHLRVFRQIKRFGRGGAVSGSRHNLWQRDKIAQNDS